MTFISYSQNFEDVLLWRALGHIKNGFYIDVGANDPVEHSVTNAFYQRGWRGINIEPLPGFQQAFAEQRPHDITIAVAAGATEAEITLFDVPSVNGWASNSQTVANAHRAEGFSVVEITVKQRTLNAICDEYVQGDIHFLKIDVEGFEGEVLRGLDLARWRPWILVVEATMPNSRLTNHESWEYLINDHSYQFAYFDGLNRYYVADEHIQLRELISVQANVFDEFISTHLDKAWENTRKAQERLRDMHMEAQQQIQGVRHEAQELVKVLIKEVSQEAHEQLRKANERTYTANMQLQNALAEIRCAEEKLAANNASLHQAEQHQQALQHELRVVYASRSWRLTQPLRWVITKIMAIRGSNLQQTNVETREDQQMLNNALNLSTSGETHINVAQPQTPPVELNDLTMSARKTLHALTKRTTSLK